MKDKSGKFVLSTKTSLFDPIEIEVDGKTYRSNKLSRSLFVELRKYEKEAGKGDLDALYKQVNIIFGVSKDVLDELDIRDIEAMLDYATNKIFNPDKKKDAEKNESKPSDKS